MTRPLPIPLRPDAAAMRSANVTSFVRACTAGLLGAYDKATSPADVLARNWPNDRAAARLLETTSAVGPTTLANFAPLRTAVADFIESLGPASAASTLLAQGLQLTFYRAAAISVPAQDRNHSVSTLCQQLSRTAGRWAGSVVVCSFRLSRTPRL
jgi:hypothetical protein